MEKLQRSALVLTLARRLKANGSWCGETHIQKTVYFLQELARVPLDYEFILYKHGPYSFDLTEDITAMQANLLLKLEAQPYPYGPSYRITDSGERLERRYASVIDEYNRQIEFIAGSLGNKKVVELERLGTALFVTLEGATDGQAAARIQRIQQLKPHISRNEACDAVSLVDNLIDEAKRLAPS